jgi:ketosteroid isomerase-like protein
VIAKDLEGWASYFDPAALVMPSNAPPLRNRQELLDFGRAYLNAFTVEEMTLDTLEMEMSGDWAYRLAEYRNQMTARLTGERYLVVGKALEIWRKQGDTWRVTHSAWTMEPSADNVQNPATSMSKEEFLAMARARVAAQNEVFLKNDPALWAGGYYAAEARLGGDDGEPMHGRTAFQGSIGRMYFAPNIYRAAKMEVLDVAPLGNYGLVRLQLCFELEPKTGGPREVYSGPCVELWQRQPDGRWLTVDAIWTSEKPRE